MQVTMVAVYKAEKASQKLPPDHMQTLHYINATTDYHASGTIAITKGQKDPFSCFPTKNVQPKKESYS